MSIEVARAALDKARVTEANLVPRHGWANEAWIGTRHVVRLSSGRLRGSLAHEAAVVEVIADGGDVPVARAVAHGLASDLPGVGRGAGEAEWLVSLKVPGDTLATYWPDLPADARRLLGNSLGTLLRAIHATPPDRVDAPRWWLDAQHDPDQLHNAYRPPVALGPEMVRAARDAHGADRALLDEVDALLAERMPLFANDVAVFLHTDIHAHNLMVSHAPPAAITGVLDWEGAHAGPADVELDMLLRYVAAAHAFPERPGASPAIAPGDMFGLVDDVAATYPELFSAPALAERLEVYDAHWHLIQILVNERTVPPAPDRAPDPAWQRLGLLIDGRSHVRSFTL